jgi:hypothetical protein
MNVLYQLGQVSLIIYAIVAYEYMCMYICVYIELMTVSVSLVDVTMMDLWNNKKKMIL